MEIIKFEVEELGSFEIKNEPTFLEQTKIEEITADLFGGVTKYNQLLIDHDTILKACYTDEKTDEETAKIQNIHPDRIALVFYLKETIERNKFYAKLKVLGIKLPKDLELFTKAELDKVKEIFDEKSSFFFAISRQNKLLRLINELHNVDFASEKVEFSDELTELYKESKSIINFWREHYNIATTDKRYLNATVSDIFSDYLIIKLRQMRDIFDEESENALINANITLEQLNAEIEAEIEAIKNQPKNYTTEEEAKAILAEEEELRKAYMLSYGTIRDPEKIRLIQIERRKQHEAKWQKN